jgi:hypothetical protein
MRRRNRKGQSQRRAIIWGQPMHLPPNPIIRMRRWTPSDDLILFKLKLNSLNY